MKILLGILLTSGGISAIKCVRYLVPYKTLLSICNSLVQPHLDYCCSVWGSCYKSLSQKLQYRATCIITFSNYDSSTDELLQMENWVNIKLDCQHLVDKSIMMYKIVSNMVLDYLRSHFVFRSENLNL